jgi:hypothetical protein
MKTKIMLLLAVLTLTFTGAAHGQPIPKGIYIAQPSLDGEKIRVYWTDHLNWPESFGLEIETARGQVTAISYWGGSPDMGTRFEYEYGAKDSGKEFRDIDVWKKFAAKVTQEFVFIGDDRYVEKAPYVFVGRSVAINHWETPDSAQHLVFKRGERILSIPLSDWFGSVPTGIGESVIIGQSGSADQFFPAIKVKNDYVISEKVGKLLAKDGEK